MRPAIAHRREGGLVLVSYGHADKIGWGSIWYFERAGNTRLSSDPNPRV